METIFNNKNIKSPKVSIILLDWNCRESFHIFDYLPKQTVARDKYEIIWIEYYQRRHPEIKARLDRSLAAGDPILDQWIVMDMPSDVYYHKHLMYNLGIVVSRGEIVVIMDSDAFMKPTFVETIIDSFQQDPNIVLHIDEVRNVERKYYPFNHPSWEELTGKGCINFKNGKTLGLWDKEDPLHTRNYGACMCARRNDFIAIGGADEHLDYLGHICGPYDMTFRLINAGKKEVWHEREFIYHTWHPGTDGVNNYLGPHDGRNVSTTALSVIKSKRVMPLEENTAIAALRRGDKLTIEQSLAVVIPSSCVTKWRADNLPVTASSNAKGKGSGVSAAKVNIFKNIFFKTAMAAKIVMMSFRQLYLKVKNYKQSKIMPKSLPLRIKLAFIFLWRMCKNNSYAMLTYNRMIKNMAHTCPDGVAIYGANEIALSLVAMARKCGLKINGIYDAAGLSKTLGGFDVLPVTALKGYTGKILLASFTSDEQKAAELKDLGIANENIVRL